MTMIIINNSYISLVQNIHTSFESVNTIVVKEKRKYIINTTTNNINPWR